MKGLTLLQEFSGRYGSAWMAVQQLRVLNALTPAEIAESIFRVKASDGRTTNAARRSLVDMRWYDDSLEEGLPDDGSAPGDLVTFLRSRALDASAGPLATILARDDVVRWCPECLRVGYHAVWFQLGALKDCPLHGVPLEESCPHCQAPNPACALISHDVGIFECARCGRMRVPFHPQRWIRGSEFATQEARVFSVLARWFRQLCQVPLEWGALNRDLGLRQNAEDESQRCAARMRAVLAMFPSRPVRRLCSDGAPLEAAIFEGYGQTATRDAYAAALQEARGVVERAVLPHSECQAPAQALWLGGARILMPCVPWNDVCCVRLANTVWQARHHQTDRPFFSDALLPATHVYAQLPTPALVRWLVSDFFETVNALSDYRARLSVPSERLIAALSLSVTPDLAGTLVPPSEGATALWIVTAQNPALPGAACAQRSAASCGDPMRDRRAGGRSSVPPSRHE